MANESRPADPRRPVRRLAILLGLLVGAGLVVTGLFYFGVLPGFRSGGPIDDFPPQALADYLPADTAAVYGFDVRQILAAAPVRAHFEGQLQQLARKGESFYPWMKVVGLDLVRDVDRLRILLAAGDPTQPLWLFQGRFPRARFPVGPGKLQEKIVGRFRLYEYQHPRTKVVTTLAPAGDYLAVSGSAQKVLDALAYAAGPHVPPAGSPVHALLKGVDQKQGVWLAAALDRLGGNLKVQIPGLGDLLNPVLKHLRAVSGHVAFGADLRGDIRFEALDRANAEELEQALQDRRNFADKVSQLAKNTSFLNLIPAEWMPLVDLVATGEIRRDGLTVHFRCHLE